MGDIDDSLNTAGYAAFALQQPLPLSALVAAAENASLPLAVGVPVDDLLMTEGELAREEPEPLSPERAELLLDVAPELQGSELLPRRRASDPAPLS